MEVSPLIRVDTEEAERALKGYLPARGPIAISPDLVADLDRTMTVEKAVVAAWRRTPGWTSDSESRRFAQALARKRKRFAFPDDLVRAIAKLRKRMLDKNGRNSDEGRAVAALVEIRATAAPSWDAASCEVFLTFVRPEVTPEIANQKWAEHLDAWLTLEPIIDLRGPAIAASAEQFRRKKPESLPFPGRRDRAQRGRVTAHIGDRLHQQAAVCSQVWVK